MAKDNSNNDKTKSRSAVASWSAYNYQGKVGIYVALHEIQELLSSSNDASLDLEKFYVEYESPEGEDFDIKKDSKTLSRHQVKATQGKTLCSYRTVIDKDSSFNITGVDEDKCYLHVSENVEGWGLSEEQYKSKYPRRTWVANLKKIRLYPYDDNREYCPIKEIKGKCSQLIKKIFNKLNPESHGHLQSEEAEDRFWRILENLDGEITKAHKNMSKQGGKRTCPTICFQEIKDIINGEDEISTNRDYARNCRRLKDKFICSCEQAVDDFIRDNKSEGGAENLYQDTRRKFLNICNEIIRKPNGDFMDLIYNFSFRFREDRTKIDFDEISVEKIITEYIMKTALDKLITEKFLCDELKKEKYILS